MLGFKTLGTLFKENLRKPEPEPTSGVTLEHEVRRGVGYSIVTTDWKFKYEMQEYVVDGYKRDIEATRKQLLRALTERKTPTRTDFEAQLQCLLDASAALAHQKLLGVSANSEMSKILERNFQTERAKLRYLVYDDLDMTNGEVDQQLEMYMEEKQ